MPTCPECGSKVDPSDRVCPECNHALDAAAIDEPPVAEPTADEANERQGDESEGAESQGTKRIDVPANPHELDVFEFSFKYPLANGYKPIALAGLLLLGFFLILPLLMFVGYQYRVGRAAAIGRSSPPTLTDFWGLLADGFRFLVAIGIGALVVGIVFAGLLLADLGTVAFAWYTVATFALTAITPVFYGTGSVRGVYANGRFVRFLATVKFWIGFAYQLGISMVLYIGFFVITIVLFITVVGILAWFPFVILFGVYASLVQASLWGRIYRDAAQNDDVDGVYEPDQLQSRW